MNCNEDTLSLISYLNERDIYFEPICQEPGRQFEKIHGHKFYEIHDPQHKEIKDYLDKDLKI